jgi:hypothetical protein
MSARRAAVLAVVALALVLSACGAIRPRVYTCATDTLPPVAVDPLMCHNGYPAVRWFSAYEGEPLPQPGLPLGYGWWHGGSGSIGYGPGYDPRPAGSYYCDSRCRPPAAPRQQYAAEPPGAARVTTSPPTKAATKAQADPPTKAASPPTRKTTR